MTQDPTALHDPAEETRQRLRELVLGFVEGRRHDEPDVGGTATPAKLAGLLEHSITAGGVGLEEAWRLFEEVVAPHTYHLDGPRFLAFIPMAPAATAIWMDAAVGAASFSAEAWLEAAGAVAAENLALDLLRGWAGMPAGAGGAFCSGGSMGNLSALAVARDQRPGRAVCLVGDTAHASITRAAHLLGLEVHIVATGPDGRLTGDLVSAAADDVGGDRVGMVVGSAGSTNAGVVDDLLTVAGAAHGLDAWFHVDGAYGAAALVRPDLRPLFAGLELADSFIVDPHKWLFSTAGACALIYREPALAVPTHRQAGPYLDVLHGSPSEVEWNPSDYAFQLTRRASGLPFWFTVAVHGVDAMATAVGVARDLARYAADAIDALPHAEVLMQPELGVVLFRRHGWDAARWQAWATELAERHVAFVAPTTHRGEVVGRLVFLHPRTTTAVVDEVVATLA